MNDIELINALSVSLFGMILSVAFCNIAWTRRKAVAAFGGLFGILVICGVAVSWLDLVSIRNLYPFLTHIPVVVLLWLLSGQFFWGGVSMLTAYFCCQQRRWFALLITFLASGSLRMQTVAELIFTIPLLFVLLKYIAPFMRSLAGSSIQEQCRFGLVPALYYLFDYSTRVYTDLLISDVPVAVEFMPFVCSVAYLAFLIYVSGAGQMRSYLEQAQNSLNLQVSQAVREIEILREQRQKDVVYRHDLRHHMQYLLNCMENGYLEQAQEYIGKVCSEIEADEVKRFCENEAANLIFSAFFHRAQKQGISIRIQAAVPAVIPVSENDLCVLLSNALENALKACQRQKEKGLACEMEVSMFEKNTKLFIQMANSCDEPVAFKNDIPVTNAPGHGIGLRSICAIVERYGGIYDFSVKEGRFILRLSL